MNLGQRGFTWVEVLVVVLSIGILLAVVVFAVGGAPHGKRASCGSEVREVRTAIEAWKTQNTGNPESLQVVVNAGFLKTAPSNVAADGNPPSPSALAGYAYTRSTGTYDLGPGSQGCPATG